VGFGNLWLTKSCEWSEERAIVRMNRGLLGRSLDC
jgi:hypothetical protein